MRENDIATYSHSHYKGKQRDTRNRSDPMEPAPKSEPISGRGPPIPRIDASTLLASSREIILVHNQQEYRLRVTSNDKLILTK